MKICRMILLALMTLLVVLLVGYNVSAALARAAGRDLPTVAGYSTAVIISGSMSGAIEIDDMVVARAQKSYASGDVILFQEPDGSRIVCHRVVRLEDGQYITKGDANGVEDSNPVPPELVIGRVRWIIPGVGLLQRFLRSPLGMMAIIAIIALMFILPELNKRRKDHKI